MLVQVNNYRMQLCCTLHFRELTLSSGHIFDSRPPVEDHGGMVVHVKKGDLVVLLPQDEEDLRVQTEMERRHDRDCCIPFIHAAYGQAGTHRVTELYDFGEEEPPADFGHLHEAHRQEITCYPLFYGCKIHFTDVL